MSSTAKSTLARLLAKENITVQHGNFKTAFFDVQSRVLGLPAWKDMSKDVYDLMIGHEVGHALYTPADFHHQIAGIRHDLVNLVEDVRIERMIQDQYPGLISCFTRGYQTLNESDFFGIKGSDVNSLGILNRLNLKFKLRNLVDIEFSADELPIKAQIEAATSWQDVIAAARALQDFIKARQEEQKQQQERQAMAGREESEQSESADADQAEEQSSDESDSADSDQTKNCTSDESDSADASDDASASDDSSDSAEDQQDADGSMQTDDKPADDAKAEQPTSTEKESAQTQDDENQGPSKFTRSNTEGGTRAPDKHADDEDLSTQTNFDSRCQKDLADVSPATLSTQFLRLPSERCRAARVMEYKRLHERRMAAPTFSTLSALPAFQASFERYLRTNKPVIAMMVKEFELRKSAHQYSRATVSKTGSLNLEKLHSYRTSDDIFLSVTKLADAKNHAMVMFVDYSGSMATILPHVLKHLINMALFCRAAGIPFKVYAFNTSTHASATDEATAATDHVLLSNMILLELISSDLSKDEFKQALYGMWLRTENHSARADLEELGGTPLNETVMIAHDIIKQFKARHNPDKMTAIFLTDGAGGRLGYSKASNLAPYRRPDPKEYYSWSHTRPGNVSVDVNGRNITFDNCKPSEGTAKLIENLRITTGCNTMGFFIPSRRSASWLAIREAIATSPMRKHASNQNYITRFDTVYRRDAVVCIPGGCSYDQYFIVGAGKDLALDDDDELEIDPSMSRSKIAREFMNFSSSKKSKRVFVTKFSEAIA